MTRDRRPDRGGRQPPARDVWVEYTRRKQEFERRNPRATPAEHQRAMKRIADELGV